MSQLLRYNLQLFAKDGPGGEKTEPASQKKLDDSRKEGNVAKSSEIVNAVSLIVAFYFLKSVIHFQNCVDIHKKDCLKYCRRKVGYFTKNTFW